MKNMTAITFTMLLAASTQAARSYFSFNDPVGDHTGIVDVVHMGFAFDDTTGDYQVVLKADAANPFNGYFRININLFNPDTGTRAQDPSSFEHNMDDYSLSSPVWTMVLTGTNTHLTAWEQGDRVATSDKPFGNPDGWLAFGSAVGDLPGLLRGDAIAYGDFTIIGPPPGAIPAPAAFVLSGMGIALVGWLRRRRTL